MLLSANDLSQNCDFIFQDESAPCHRSKVVAEWYYKKNTQTLKWPRNRPNMKPIETCWAILKQKVREIFQKK